MEIVKATDENIQEIVNSEIERLGNTADLNHIDVSSVTSMNYMFNDSQFNGDISKWDVSSVTNMRSMFDNSPFNGDISKWDVSRVTDVDSMYKTSP